MAKHGKARWENPPGVANVNARACLIFGPPGIGKTSAVRIISSEMGFGVLEINASDKRSKNKIDDLIRDLSQS